LRRIESVIDAVAAYNHYSDPESEAYELRNPLMMLDHRPNAPTGKRRFSCHRAGITASFDRISQFCREHPDGDLSSLLEYCGIKMKQQQDNAIDFMARCANSTLTLQTKLSWFIQNA
jgi:hypothetical protein